MEVTRLADGLWRWTTAHPEWKPGGGWEREVGCVYWEAVDAVVLVDPLIPVEVTERGRFLAALDRDVERVARPVVALRTCAWHERNAAELAERYGGRVVADGAGELPPGVAVVDVPAAKEVVYWLEGAASLVPGDVLLGADDALRLCPASWLPGTKRDLAAQLLPLLELPVERVLVSHGEPVLSDGLAALDRALAGYSDA